jgi:uncharacterized protein (DUF58 family)
MVPTPRSIALAGSGALILFGLILARSVNTLDALVFVLAFNLLLLLVFLADWFLTPPPAALTVERSYEHRLSLGAANPVTVRIENRSPRNLAVTVRDEPPDSFAASEKYLQGRIAPGAAVTFRYTLEPPRRGDYRFGRINIRYQSRLGLFLRQFHREPENNHIRVYPNIREIRKYQILTRRAHLIESGLKPTRAAGLGTDFESLRDYQVDDTYRRINWGASARRGRLTVNQYEVDRSQNILLVMDTGRMMSGGGNPTRLDHAINAALLLGYVGVSYDDKVGLLAFADDVRLYLPPRKGQPQLQKILSALYNLQPDIVESDYRAACRYIGFKNRKRSLICFFSDLIDEEASSRLITHVSSLTGNHLVMCITMLDRSLAGQAKALPSESREVYEKGVAHTVQRSRERAISSLKSRGVVVVDVPPEELSLSTINRYLEIKTSARL